MKTKVFITSGTGIECVPGTSQIGVLPDQIFFSSAESYLDSYEMDAESFISRIKIDDAAKPTITGCSKEKVFDILEDANFDGYDNFYFILSPSRMSYYKPIIAKFLEENKDITCEYYEVKSESYPVVFMAMQAEQMLSRGTDLEEVTDAITFYDNNNKIYLYSPSMDILPVVEKITYDEDVFMIRSTSMFYLLRQGNSLSVKLREKNKTISPYLDEYIHEIETKDCIPFLVYTNEFSRYKDVFGKLLEKIFPKKKVRAFLLSPEMVDKYGKFSCGLGLIENRQI